MTATYQWRGQILTMRELTKATGVTRQAIDYHLDRHGNLDNLEPHAPKAGALPFWIGGRVYPSQATIARIIGEHQQTVQRWIADGKTDQIAAKLKEARA